MRLSGLQFRWELQGECNAMITIQEKALNYVKKTGLSFVVKTITVNLTC
jgi:hypothetical protein